MTYPAEDSDYYRKFNLVRDPFPLDNTGQVLYLTPELNRRLDLLVQRAATRGPVQVILSPPGGGKTVIAEYLASLKEPDWLVGLVRAEPHTDADFLSLALLKKYFPDEDVKPGQAVDRLQQLLESSELNGKIPVFLIDDAHILSADGLRFILQLAADSPCRVMLFANETINDLFDKPELNGISEEHVKRLYLPPLSQEQTRAYIDNRLSLSGEANAYPFTDEELQQITRISAGLPGGINLLARQYMQQKTAGRTGNRNGNVWLLAAAFSAVLLLAAAYYYLSHSRITAAGEAPAVAATAAKQQQYTGQTPATEEQGGQARKSVTKQQLFNAQVSLDLPSTPAPAVAGADTKVPQPDVTGNSHPAEDTQTQTPAAAEAQTVEQGAPETEQKGSSPAAGEQAGNETAGSPAPAKMPDGNIYRLDPVPAIVKGIKGPAWLRQQSPDLYVLQILSVSNFNNLARMLNKIPEMQDQYSGYTNYTPSGKPRYLLYYGLYPDKERAYAAIKDIPMPLQAVNPWPRSIKSILAQLQDLQARGYY